MAFVIGSIVMVAISFVALKATGDFWMFVAIFAGGIAGGLTGLAWMSHKVARSRFLTRRYVNLAYGTKKCTHCTVGTQILNENNEWGPMPEHLQMVRKGVPYVGSRQANVRPCPWCNASGMRPYEIPGMLDQGHVEYRQ